MISLREYLVCCFALTLLWLILRNKNFFRSIYVALQLPGPKAIPLLGNVSLISDHKTLIHMGDNGNQLYGPLYRVWITVIPFFVIVEPQHLQLILSKNRQSTKGFLYNLLHNFIGEGLITISGPIWKEHRRLMQPFFQKNALKLFFSKIHKYSLALVDDLKDKSDVKIAMYTNKFVLHLLHDSVFGIPVMDNGEPNPFRDSKFILPTRITRPWLLWDSIFKLTKSSKAELFHKALIQNYTRAILNSKKNSAGESTSFIELMMEVSENNPERFSEHDVINESSTLMLAGQDSIGAALSFCFYFIAKDQDVQEKIVSELGTIFRGSDRPTSFEDVIEMDYLEQCIKEVLRLCPTVPVISRTLTEDVAFGKYVLPSGSQLCLSPFATHRLEHIFPEPLKFNPDRFSPENISKIHPYGYIPFSAGPRNCIGYRFALLQLKTVMADVLRKYDISLVPGQEELKYIYRAPTLKASGGIWIRLNERNKQ